MAIDLPRPIADYFEADKGLNAEAVAACFAPVAVVRDEGHSYAGRDAIRRWKDQSSAKYTYTAEPFSIADEDGRIVVTCHVVGDFPGSPVDLRYFFALDGGEIAELEIVP
ncbi:nuclear transport factor 2 family protein [Altererythrobacter sp. C41]|uniref:nuclear transport factor 2 family protein n=1 Tax=Altererythrobacter sp. C41 TaxID=2806021 RepID=UPI001933AE32|nr:nuclear transport factor 2 family protein [Altererythrobacter sp. C41]MBM0171152.1 nuclear transport factor 2 family protein [Altererythrobacter sp. C41]